VQAAVLILIAKGIYDLQLSDDIQPGGNFIECNNQRIIWDRMSFILSFRGLTTLSSYGFVTVCQPPNNSLRVGEHDAHGKTPFTRISRGTDA
jgi:hypothetical protein